ncbi:hypothetical protein ACFSTD_15425 [Novosphingobium colocasiae]
MSEAVAEYERLVIAYRELDYEPIILPKKLSRRKIAFRAEPPHLGAEDNLLRPFSP